MFLKCESLETIDFSGVQLTTDKQTNMFRNCKNLKEIIVTGCDESTISKLKEPLSSAGLSESLLKK